MNIFEVVDKLMSDDDKQMISDISNYKCDKLIDDISKLSEGQLANVFSSEKIIKDKELTKKGLHIFRTLFAEKVAEGRRLFLGADKSPYYNDYINDGVIVIEDFIPKDLWEIEKKIAHTNVKNYKQGYHLNLSQNKEFQSLIVMTTAIPMEYHTLGTEFLVHVDDDRQFVPEFLHSDTFQPTVKIWLYLEDVNLEKGPLSYVYSSHKKTFYILEWLYRLSNIAVDDNHKDFEKYIFRDDTDVENWSFSPCLFAGADEDGINAELEKLNLKPIKRLVGKENTLVMIDSSGFHGRGRAKAGVTRFSFRGGIRENPFLYF